MRTHRFTFTKTKTTKHKAISVDLTKQEAVELLFRLESASGPEEPSNETPEEAVDEAMYELCEQLKAFVGNLYEKQPTNRGAAKKVTTRKLTTNDLIHKPGCIVYGNPEREEVDIG